MVYTLSSLDFNANNNLVLKSEPVEVPVGSAVNMLRGNDQVSGLALGSATDTADQAGLFLRSNPTPNPSSLFGGSGNDVAQGTASTGGAGRSAFGIRLGYGTTLDMGVDNDIVRGSATAFGASSSAYGIGMVGGAKLIMDSAALFGGNDLVVGEAQALVATTKDVMGIAMGGLAGSYPFATSIESGGGNDVIIGRASAAAGTTGRVFGIYNGASTGSTGNGVIDTGAGNDVVEATAKIGTARANGFGARSGSTLTVNLGSGSDVAKGFGNVFLNGGSGFDVYNLSEYTLAEFDFTGFIAGNGVTVQDASNPSIKAVTTGFEAFIFKDAVLPYSALPFV